MQCKITIACLSGLILFLSACHEETVPTVDQSHKTIITNYSKQALNTRLRIPQYEELMSFNDIPNLTSTNARVKRQNTEDPENYVFVMRAEVQPPVYQDRSLRASHVNISGNRAFVSYNTEGETYLGGVDLFDISNVQSPSLLAQVIVDGADFSAVTYHDNKIYLAGARELQDEDTLKSPAIVEIIEIEQDMVVGEPILVDIAGFTATDVKVHDNKLYVTSGTNGGLSIYDLPTLTLLEFQPMDDARSVAFDLEEFVVMQGTPARVTTYDNLTHASINTYTPGGADIPESKSMVDIKDHLIYVPAGRDGLKVLQSTTGDAELMLPLPTIEDVAPEFIVTNGISINSDKVFIANGAAGLYVAEQQTDNIAVLGSINFNASVNYVESKEDVIFVATGAGGLKILEIMKYNPGNGDYIDIGDWDNNGKPEYICENASTINAQLVKDIFNELKANKNITTRRPEWFTSAVVTDLALIKDTDVSITFLHEGAGYKNTLGYYTYPTAQVPASASEVLDFTVLYPNVTYKSQGGPLERGDKICLQQLKAGSSLGFFLNANSFKDGKVNEGLYTLHTTPMLNTKNPEGMKQNSLLLYDEATGTIVLSFEDIRRPGGDKDFEDAVFLLKLSNPEAVDTSKLTRLK